MKPKKKMTDENIDRIERLKLRYAKWKEKQCLEELIEIDEYTLDEPNDLNLERHWE